MVIGAEGYYDTNVLIKLLDNAIALGDTAGQLKEALGGNGHRPEKAAALIENLYRQV